MFRFPKPYADRVAKSVSEKYAKADADTQAKMAEKLGMPGPKIAELSGPNYLRSKVFLGKYHEIPDSKIIGKIVVQGDQATLNYEEPDGDKEKLNYARQEGKWKVGMPLPKFVK